LRARFRGIGADGVVTGRRRAVCLAGLHACGCAAAPSCLAVSLRSVDSVGEPKSGRQQLLLLLLHRQPAGHLRNCPLRWGMDG
jgi:hypothetical protein